MGSLQADDEMQKDLNDSGIGQEESITIKKQLLMETDNRIQLLDLSDDVLLYILKHCPPRDLKALGFTCYRLGTLVLDRTLWERVDSRDHPVGIKRLRWLLKYGISSSTSEILLSGYARQVKGCLGRLNCRYPNQGEPVPVPQLGVRDSGGDPRQTEGEANEQNVTEEEPVRRGIIRGGPIVQIYESMPTSVDPLIPSISIVDQRIPMKVKRSIPSNNDCPGPQFTLTSSVLVKIETRCPNLTSLALEYCNLDCSTTSIQQFPRTLKVLSLRGSKCYSQIFDKTFLFKIQDNLQLLEELNLSECEWVEPSSLLPLSKLPALRRLYMRNCCKMCDCVAYSSLATRYGFSALQVIDLRESPVGDSEVSSFGWVASLEELYVSPAPEEEQYSKHGHYIGDELPENRELDPWEEQEPEYMDKMSKTEEFDDDDDDVTENYDSPSRLKRRRMNDSYVKALKYALFGQGQPEIDLPDDSDINEAKRSRQNGVNEGASTSNAPHSPEAPGTSNEPSVATTRNTEDSTSDNQGEPTPQNMFYIPENREIIIDRSLEESREMRSQGPVYKMLYVNVCRRLHAAYRLSLPVYSVEEPADFLGDNQARRLNISNRPFMSPRLDPSTLVSDTSVHRFGRADTDNVNYINIGPNGIAIQRDHRVSRPDRSNLRVLYVRGFVNITNRSLVHLATAAPRLRLLDVTETRVNEHGVENFRSLRPDCEVLYTKREKES